MSVSLALESLIRERCRVRLWLWRVEYSLVLDFDLHSDCFNPKSSKVFAFLQMEGDQAMEDAAYKLVEVEGKGRGLVAAKTLNVGELVVSEKMFLKMASGLEYDVSSFARLNKETKRKLMKLSTCLQ